MKSALIPIFLILGLSGNAIACTYIKQIDDGSVTIKLDDDVESGMYHVRAPIEYKGAKLEYLILSVKKGEDELALPLSIKWKGGIAGSHFHMPKHWVNIRISASYEGQRCLELVANLNM